MKNAIVICIALAVAAFSATAQAQPPKSSAQTGAYCVVALAATPSVLLPSEVVSYDCYANEAQRNLSSTTNLSLLSSAVLGYGFTSTNTNGSVLEFVGADGVCTSTRSYNFLNFQSPWNNNFESALTRLASCNVSRYFDTASLGGDSIACYLVSGAPSQTCAETMGSMNNRASSVTFFD